MRNSLLLSAAFAATTALATRTSAQVTTVDEGRFNILRGGQKVGTEDFKIRSTADPSGAVLTATATVAYDDRRLSPTLRTDAGGSPLAYQVEVRVGSELQERLSGQIGRGRFSARVRTPTGESAKEYIVSDGALVLDDNVFHQYYFLGRRDRVGTLPVVIPRRNVQVAARVESRGNEQITIGGQSVTARQLVLVLPGEAPRHVWLDAQGRVLKVMLESSGVVAVRDELPR